MTALRHVSETEENITVMWDKPEQYKESYLFNLSLQSSDGFRSVIAEKNRYDFGELTPGRRYHISVTTQTADGTQGDSEQISPCTSKIIKICVNSIVM